MSRLVTRYDSLLWQLKLNKLSRNPEKDIFDGRVKIDGKLIKDINYRLNAERNGTRIVTVKQPNGYIKQRMI